MLDGNPSMFSLPKLLAISGLITLSGIGTMARADQPISFLPATSGWGDVVLTSAEDEHLELPESPFEGDSGVQNPGEQNSGGKLEKFDLTEAGVLLPGPAQSTGRIDPQPLVYYYPGRSERLYDET